MSEEDEPQLASVEEYDLYCAAYDLFEIYGWAPAERLGTLGLDSTVDLVIEEFSKPLALATYGVDSVRIDSIVRRAFTHYKDQNKAVS